MRRVRDRPAGDQREDSRRGRGLRYRALAGGRGRQGPRRRKNGRPGDRRLPVQRSDPHQRAGVHGAALPPQVQGPGGLRLLRRRGLHSRAGQHEQPGGDLRELLRRNSHDRESQQGPSPAGDQGSRGDAPPAGVLRHGSHAGPDRARGLLPARLPARGRSHLGRDRGDPRREASGARARRSVRTRPFAIRASARVRKRRSRSSIALGR